MALQTSADDSLVGGAATRSFLRSLCQSQMASRFLQRHTSLYLRPFHALCATMSASLSMLATRSWEPRVGRPSHVLVVPPPGGPSCLAPWQPSVDGARLLPDAAYFLGGNGGAVPATSTEKKTRKKDRREEADLARKWTAGEVSAALGLESAEQEALTALILRAAAGDMGPHGDDVGGVSEGVDAAAGETAMLLAAATKAAGSAANPAAPRRRAPRNVLKAAAARPPRSRFGLFGGSASAAAASAAIASDESGAPSLIYEWLQRVLVTWAAPSLERASGGSSSRTAMVRGVIWSSEGAFDDDRLLALCSSRAARATFVRVLQAQVLFASGLGNPEYGAVPGAFVHSQVGRLLSGHG